MSNQGPSFLYQKDVIEFVTVTTEFCVRAEQTGEVKRTDFVAGMLKILPLLYMKAMVVMELLKSAVTEPEGEAEKLVTEQDYDFVRENVARVMAEQDDYLDVFVEDMKYSDQPIRRTISEDLADIYQDLRNFVGVYKQGFDEAMEVALHDVMDEFPRYWGQRTACVLRALHDNYFSNEE